MKLRFILATLVATLTNLGNLPQAYAQTSTWTGLGATPHWSLSGNWDILPALGGSATTAIVVGGTLNNNSIMDLGVGPLSTFQLNSLTLTSDASSGFYISGGRLEFTGTSPTLTFNSGPLVTMTINSDVHFSSNTAISIDPNSTGVTTELALKGTFSGSGNVTVSSSGPGRDMFIASPNNHYTGTLTTTRPNVFLLAPNALGRNAPVQLNGGSLITFIAIADTRHSVPIGYHSQQLANLSATGTDSRIELGSSASSALMWGFNNANTTYAGFMFLQNADNMAIKVGTGSFEMTGNSTPAFNGTLSIRDGTFRVGGNSGVAGGLNPATGSHGFMNISEGAVLLQTMTGTGSNGRLPNNMQFTFNGGQYRLDASGLGSSTAGYSEVVGPLTIGHGESNIRIDTSTVRGSRLSFTSLSRTAANYGTLFVQSGNLGNNPLDTAGSGNVHFSSSITGLLVGTTTTYSPTALDLAILPFGIASPNSSSGTPTTFMTYDSANGSLRGLADTNYASSFGTATHNVSLNSATSLTSATTANSLRTTGTAPYSIDLGSHNLTLTSGALLDTNSATTQFIGSGGTLIFSGTNGAFVSSVSNTTLVLGVPVSAAHFIKSGPGTVSITNTVSLGNTATVAVNAGTLTLGTGGSITAADNKLTYKVMRNATLNVGVGLTLNADKVLTGNGTVTGFVTLANGSTVEPLAFVGPGTLTVDSMAWQGGSKYRWNVSSVLTETNYDSVYTASKIYSSSGTLDLTGASITNKITIEIVSQRLQGNAGAVYDALAGPLYTWRIAEFGGGIIGFDPDKFILNDSGFTPAGVFGIYATADSIYLTVVVPEPTSVLGLGSVVLLGAGALRRRLRRKASSALAA